MISTRNLLIAIALLIAGTVAAAFAAVPQTVNYQGYLTNGGTPVHNIATPATFSLYSSNPARSNPVWRESKSVSPINGIYSTQLGSATPITAPFDVPYYLGVNVNNTGELPLQALSSVPYARRAAVADTLTNGASVPGAFPPLTISSTSVQAAANNTYTLTGAATATVTLPTNASVGDVIRVNGQGAGGYTFNLANGQTITGSSIPADFKLWVPVNIPRYWTSIATTMDGTKLVAVADHIYTSSNGGNTWLDRGFNAPWKSVAFSADGSTLFAVAYNQQIYKSTDGGGSWGQPELSPMIAWRSVAVSANGSTVVAVAENENIQISTDGGNNWNPAADTRVWRSVVISPDGGKIVAVCEEGFIYISNDGGLTWPNPHNTGGDGLTSIAMSADGNTLLVASYSQLRVSRDGGATWLSRSIAANFWLGAGVSPDGLIMLASPQYDLVYISTDRGETWTPTTVPAVEYASFAFSGNSRKIWAAVNGDALYKTSAVDFSAPQYTSTELVYAGNGQWQLKDAAAIGHSNSTSGSYAAISGGSANTASSDNSFVGGGYGNQAGGLSGTIGGGYINSASGDYSTVSGGYGNSASALKSTIAGGSSNAASRDSAAIGGGFNNSASDYYTTISGGYSNKAINYNATIGGGSTNTASGGNSSISGGEFNTASGLYSTVAGGSANKAGGDYSLAAGRRAKVRDAAAAMDTTGDQGTFVWADSQNADFVSTGQNQFLIRAQNGVGINTNNPTAALDVIGNARVSGTLTATGGLAPNTVTSNAISNNAVTSAKIAMPLSLTNSSTTTTSLRVNSDNAQAIMGVSSNHVGVWAESSGVDMFGVYAKSTNGVALRAEGSNNSVAAIDALSFYGGDLIRAYGGTGGNNTGQKFRLDVWGNASFAGNVTAANFPTLSDVRLKTDILPLENTLDKVLRLRGVSYVMKADTTKERKIGVIAQELEQEYPELVMTDDKGMKSVTYSNLTAVLIEAVKGLKAENDILKARLEKIEQLLNSK